MTIIYQYRVATTTLGGFLKLLVTWRGSMYKLLFKEFLIFCCLYTTISLTYRFALGDQQKLLFETIVLYCNSFTNLIPVSFVLGFYVTIVVQRWWQQFMNVPWPDRTIFIMCTYLNGPEERARIMRRSVARYMMFGLILIMRSVSMAVMKRFPTLEHIVDAGFITREEAEMYEAVQCQYHKFWVPLMWVNNIFARARQEGRIETEFGLRMVIEQLADFRDKCSTCFVYDWITIPLVYTQVVTLAVYSFFAASLLGRQFLDPEKKYPGYEYDTCVPVFTLLQFSFYMGWLKVAEQMINPFGEDDDDYDINWLLDRHTAVAFALVDQCCGRHPVLVRDQHWNEAVMPEMPYTEASLSSKRPNFLGSTFNIAGLSGSHEIIDSGDHHGRVHSVPNGKTGYLPLMPMANSGTEKSRMYSLDMMEAADTLYLDIPDRRERSNSERNSTGATPVRERKLSSPSRFHLFTKKDNSNENLPPKNSRFTVEPVEEPPLGPDNMAVGNTDTNAPSVTRTRRSGQPILSMLYQMSSKAVSRPPLLSAIEETNTVNSLQQILSSGCLDYPTEAAAEETMREEETSGAEKTLNRSQESSDEDCQKVSTYPTNSIPIISITDVDN